MNYSDMPEERQTSTDNPYRRIIISGGGTGGHIFPAIAIANALSAQYAPLRILFVGAEGRMEMKKVPEAGYRIIGLPVRGFDRKHLWKNFEVLYRLVKSLFIARIIIRRFRPDAVIGVGGYASGPVLFAASRKGIPTLIQEQNSYAGVTNRILAKRVNRICVAYEGMERYFPADRITVTGNPVRESLLESTVMREQSMLFFDFAEDRPTILSLGGSLGARTINRSVLGALNGLPHDIYMIWQTGEEYYEIARRAVADKNLQSRIKVFRFIERMDLAFAASDLVISRAGASTISELCITGKPCILVPSPNVAEDHQTKNAMTLTEKGAAIMIPDSEAGDRLMSVAIATVQNRNVLEPLADRIRMLAKFRSAETIAHIVMEIMNSKRQKK
ncbi:MAG: undecaprenyldiphospho-muramoylpentapeptide beta-N-acetylglucosaminyltransferase [Bacteroidales bacterium]|jgi:UDP-N-acetylglucosamine--N-acetylmuramyl-(pentapeptide) pyrophosphoryl-undecaprenol N-acetylglucosamine transferase|nr:undecaprenyldiphospho-muramoylpentapeptide beta-N-acetylglucosaminyltransferase [Bacteroidales bacterium]